MSLMTTHMGLPIDASENRRVCPRPSCLPKDVQRLVAKAPHLIRATADVAGTVNQLSLRPRSWAIRGWLARDLAEVAGRALALMATLDGGTITPGNLDLVEAHKASYLKNP